MSEPVTYASFMIGVWRDVPGNEAERDWVGEIEFVQSGHTWRFQSVEALLKLLGEQLSDQGELPK